MSIYQVKQSPRLLNESFNITKDDSQLVYRAESEVLVWGQQLKIKDASGKEVAQIKQTKVATALPEYEIVRHGTTWATLSKNNMPGSLSKELVMEIPGQQDYKVVGKDFPAWHFVVERIKSGTEVAVIDKKLGLMDDYGNYGVKIESGEDDLAVLLICIAIDLIYHSDENNN